MNKKGRLISIEALLTVDHALFDLNGRIIELENERDKALLVRRLQAIYIEKFMRELVQEKGDD